MSTLPQWKKDFLSFCLECEVLRFGDFTLKSGRSSPYFFNAGLFNTGGRLARLGGYYAAAIAESGLQYDVIFGPAYKGIPLAAATSIALAQNHGADMPYCYNRKEAKEHGEGGTIVGAALKGRTLVVDDVITAGTAIRESASLIAAQDATIAGVVVALDREELGGAPQRPPSRLGRAGTARRRAETGEGGAGGSGPRALAPSRATARPARPALHHLPPHRPPPPLAADTELTAIQQVKADLGVPVVAVATLADLIVFMQESGRADEATRLVAHRAERGPKAA